MRDEYQSDLQDALLSIRQHNFGEDCIHMISKFIYCIGKENNEKQMNDRIDFKNINQDFSRYIQIQKDIDLLYGSHYRQWMKLAVLGISTSSTFSSDKMVRQYAEEIWNINN
mmetsp:Transcript_7793/g.13077  ORF Transcript_7793/g.13077 Transcript_7793/m.13077 type:complete len:112 (+) Transcript_7793:420-755(+)